MQELYEVIKMSDDEFNIEVSRFHNLVPVGIGTPYVECLSSYIVRLAEEYDVNPSSMIMYEISNFLTTSHFDPNRTSSKGYAAAGAMNGRKRTAIEWSDAIAQLTRRSDIQYMTLLPFKEVFSEKGLLRDHRAWCPSCFSDWKEKKLPIYEPLLWKIREVRMCPIHYQNLSFSCRFCGKKNTHIAPMMKAGHCNACGKWLGEASTSDIETDQSTRNLWVAETIGSALEMIQTMESLPARENISAFFTYLLNNKVKGGVREFGRLAKMQHTYLSDWINEKHVPVLNKLLYICDLFKISLLDAICFPRDIISDIQLQSSVGESSSLTKPQNRVNWPKIEDDLTMMASGELPPKEIKSFAAEHNCHVSNLYRVYPERCKEVSERMRTQLTQERIAQNKKLKEQIVQIISGSDEDNAFPTKNEIYKIIGGKSRNKRALVTDVFDEIGCR